jgi:hypothetical protein
MDSKRFIVGTIVGGIVLFLTGYAIFNFLLAGFYDANAAGSAAIARTAPLLWAIAVGCLGYAALICYAGSGRASGLAGGAKVGAVVGFLLWFAADFIAYGTQDIATLTAVLVDPLVGAVHGAIGGAVIGLLVSKMKPGV